MSYRSLIRERSAMRHVRSAAATEHIPDASEAEAEQPFNAETEINRLMDEDERVPRPPRP